MIITQKSALREEIKKLLAKVPREEFRREGESSAALLRASPLWSRYKTVFLFLSMNSEIDTEPLFESALNAGKKVFAPKIVPDADSAGKLIFVSLSSPDDPWTKGPFGIREPVEPSRGKGVYAALEDFPALIVSPGLAFDREGKRLGRGGGYYDRFFAELDKAGREYAAIGFCMNFQLKEKIPAENTDKSMDGVAAGNQFFTLWDRPILKENGFNRIVEKKDKSQWEK